MLFLKGWLTVEPAFGYVESPGACPRRGFLLKKPGRGGGKPGFPEPVLSKPVYREKPSSCSIWSNSLKASCPKALTYASPETWVVYRRRFDRMSNLRQDHCCRELELLKLTWVYDAHRRSRASISRFSEIECGEIR